MRESSGHNHLGLVVADTQKTIDFYTKTLGMPEFRTGEYPMPRGFYPGPEDQDQFPGELLRLRRHSTLSLSDDRGRNSDQ